MLEGFIKVAAITPKTVVADVKANEEEICRQIKAASEQHAKIIVLPELCITGYTCSDLFFQDALIRAAERALGDIACESVGYDMLVFVGTPLSYEGKLYNTAAVLNKGDILGLVPKKYLPNYHEFYEVRHFTKGMEQAVEVELKEGLCVPMGTNLIFSCKEIPELKVAAEICEDLWTPNPPSISHALAGATVIANLSASDEITGKDIYRRELVKGQAARLLCGYIYASAGRRVHAGCRVLRS